MVLNFPQVGLSVHICHIQVNAQGSGVTPALNEETVIFGNISEPIKIIEIIPLEVKATSYPTDINSPKADVTIILDGNHTGCCFEGWRYNQGCVIVVRENFFICDDGDWHHIFLDAHITYVSGGKKKVGQFRMIWP
ncbi:uncharacterized protein [Macrobrachium rosenbergii]|uniref:uncharacterized protein n=1 Tax=Macrobrachium rosenbergii TaxID=79674 RepID=UPI0034D647F2